MCGAGHGVVRTAALAGARGLLLLLERLLLLLLRQLLEVMRPDPRLERLPVHRRLGHRQRQLLLRQLPQHRRAFARVAGRVSLRVWLAAVLELVGPAGNGSEAFDPRGCHLLLQDLDDRARRQHASGWGVRRDAGLATALDETEPLDWLLLFCDGGCARAAGEHCYNRANLSLREQKGHSVSDNPKASLAQQNSHQVEKPP